MFLLYDLIFVLVASIYFPFLVCRKKWHKDFVLRLGFWPKNFADELKGSNNIWIHAVSVGEILAVADLIETLKSRQPNYRFICSTVTTTGYQVAMECLGSSVKVIYAPLDGSWIVNKFVSAINPKIYIATETEIWPNLFTALGNRRIPIVLINGRISDRSYDRYKIISPLLRPILKNVTRFFMQSPEDAVRIKNIGAPDDRVTVAGNIKFDINVDAHSNFPAEFHYLPSELLWVAGSTHPGEEAVVLNTYKDLCEIFPALRLVIAPRHIERSEEVARIVESVGLNYVYLSKIDSYLDSPKVIVVDTIGKLRYLYQVASIVFVGKTLRVGGGQNMIEPCAYGKTTIVGPMTENFRDVMKILLNHKVIHQISHESELFTLMAKLLENPKTLEINIQNIKKVVGEQGGATLRTIEAVESVLRHRKP